jgi:hypothetical protein
MTEVTERGTGAHHPKPGSTSPAGLPLRIHIEPMSRSTAIPVIGSHTIKRRVAPEPRRTLRDLVTQLRDLGPIRFRRRLTAPVLVWNAVTGPVFDEPGKRRPTKRVKVYAPDELQRVAELSEQVWFLRSRSEFGSQISIVAGRAGTCDVILNDYSISQEHCLMTLRTWKGPPARFDVRIKDLGSLNGTTLEGEAVGTEEFVRVKPGVALEIGRLALTLLEPDDLFGRVRSISASLPENFRTGT